MYSPRNGNKLGNIDFLFLRKHGTGCLTHSNKKPRQTICMKQNQSQNQKHRIR